MPQKSIARQKTEATPGNYWGLPIKGPGFLLQIITAAFFTAPTWMDQRVVYSKPTGLRTSSKDPESGSSRRDVGYP